ncbi:MAG: DUF3037 domain-containing protein [Saprospiraceae bacterium]
MPEKLVYEFALIHFVPKVERGEYMNIGVILLCKKKKYLQMKYHLDESRLRALAPDIDLANLAAYLRAWDLICHGSPLGGPIAQLDPPNRFRWLTASRSTIIQSSKVHPGICIDPEWVLEDLFQKYVL